MEMQFLGTSSGTPTKSRNVSALALRSPGSGHWVLVDCGEGTQHRILHTNLSLMTLRAIFITHLHGDHCYGLPGLLASAGMLNRSETLFIVGPPPIEAFVRCVMQTTQLALPYPVQFVGLEEVARADLLPDLRVHVTALSHRVPSFAYSFTERAVENKLDAAKLKREGVEPGPLWGQLQQGSEVTAPDGRVLRPADYLVAPRKARKIIVGGDNDTPALLRAEATGADVLVHEATYTDDVLEKVGPGPQHSSARMVAQFASEANIGNLVLTHFSPRYQEGKGERSLSEIESEARAHYKGKLFLANDLERFVLGRDGNLAQSTSAQKP
jgi:ribonuclease Z